MLALKYLLGVFVFIGVYQLGKWMTKKGYQWSTAPAPLSAHLGGMQKFLLYAGRIFQVIAVIWGFLDAVSVMVLVF